MALNDKRLYTILSHVATWSVLFLLPMTFGPHNFPTILLPTAPVVAIFYLNYTWMASLYMDGHKASVWMIDMFLVFAFAFARCGDVMRRTRVVGGALRRERGRA